MLTENDVINAVAIQLQSEGYEITQALNTREKGIDLIAIHPKKQHRVLVEAKGATSARKSSARYGKPFTLAQVRDHVANAFFTAAKLLSEHRSDDVTVAIALPRTDLHVREIAAAAAVVRQLGIIVYWVDDNGRVFSSELDSDENHGRP